MKDLGGAKYMQSLLNANTALCHEAHMIQRLFTHTASSLKFLLFLGIVRRIEQEPTAQLISYDMAAANMVALTRHITADTSISFGHVDAAVAMSQRVFARHKPETFEDAASIAMGKFSIGEEQSEALLRYARFRLIRPFFTDLPPGIEGKELDQKLIESAELRFNELRPLYRLDETNRQFVLHPSWHSYLMQNCGEALNIVLDRFARWLGIFNRNEVGPHLLYPPRDEQIPNLLVRLKTIVERPASEEADSDQSDSAQTTPPMQEVPPVHLEVAAPPLRPSETSLLAKVISSITAHIDATDCSLETAILAKAINSKGLADKESLLQEALMLLIPALPSEANITSDEPAHVVAVEKTSSSQESNIAVPSTEPSPPPVVSVPVSPSHERPPETAPPIDGPSEPRPIIRAAKLASLVRFLVDYLQKQDGQCHLSKIKDHLGASSLEHIKFVSPHTNQPMDLELAMHAALRHLCDEALALHMANPSRYRLTQKGWKYGEKSETETYAEKYQIKSKPVSTKPVSKKQSSTKDARYELFKKILEEG